MPTTVNGIGTHYYGKKNLSVRAAHCGSCGRYVNLSSYDTRLWFVVVFIPVIPLGRKRIIDQCPSCTRHRVADADSYEQARQLQITASLERFRREPEPETAIETHAQFLAFHEHEQAAEFRAQALERFPQHAGMRVAFAKHLEQVSSWGEAAQLFDDAHALEPELPEARVGVALRRMAAGNLDEAAELLDFLMLPGAGERYSLGPIDTLASYYQKAGRHEETLRIAEHLLREFPPAGEQHSFRRFVRTSEKALRREESILPPQRHSLRGLFRAEGSPYPGWLRKTVIGGVAVALLGAGLMINNEYIRTHRTVLVLNACEEPVSVQVDGQAPERLAGDGRLVVAEGRHRIKVSGAATDTHDIELRSGYFERWSHKPVWILNPGGEAVLVELIIHYAQNPPPPQSRLIVGQPFVAFPHVDYAFTEPPKSVSMSKNDGVVTKTVLRRIEGEDDGAFFNAFDTDANRALTFAEHRLRRHPNDDGLLKAYVVKAATRDAPRVEAFLKSGLDRKPLSIPWHRDYQSFAQMNGHREELIGLYDRALAADPKNGALLYLRGRIEPDWVRQGELYERSAEADPQLAWPLMAMGSRAAAGGHWDDAIGRLQKAKELKADEEQVEELLFAAREAKGETSALVKELRQRLTAEPTDFKTVVLLCEALVADGHPDQIRPTIASWESRLPEGQRLHLGQVARANAFYAEGKLEECVQACGANPPLGLGRLRGQALCALGRSEEAAAEKSLMELWEDPWTELAVSLGLQLDGHAEEAARWHERACKRMESLFTDTRRAAKILRASEPVAVDALSRVNVDPEEKALMFAVLTRRFPAKEPEYRAAADRYNVRRKPPYHLVKRALERPPTSS